MVEYLGSGVPRILEHYERSCFHFSDNFLRMVFPATETVTSQSTEEGNINEQFRNVQAAFGSVVRRLAYSKEENIAFLRDNYGLFTG